MPSYLLSIIPRGQAFDPTHNARVMSAFFQKKPRWDELTEALFAQCLDVINPRLKTNGYPPLRFNEHSTQDAQNMFVKILNLCKHKLDEDVLLGDDNERAAKDLQQRILDVVDLFYKENPRGVLDRPQPSVQAANPLAFILESVTHYLNNARSIVHDGVEQLANVILLIQIILSLASYVFRPHHHNPRVAVLGKPDPVGRITDPPSDSSSFLLNSMSKGSNNSCQLSSLVQLIQSTKGGGLI